MRYHGKVLMCALGSLVLCARAGTRAANPSGNPYQSIVERNVFGLKPPLAPEAELPTRPPPPKITLTGITTMGGKRALLSTPPLPGKAVGEARPQYYTLGEGQREGDLEVLAIDERARAVKVNYGGTVLTLDFNENGAKPAPAPLAGMAAAASLSDNPLLPAIRREQPFVHRGSGLPPNKDSVAAAAQIGQMDPAQLAFRRLMPLRDAAGNIVPANRRRAVLLPPGQ